MNASWQSLILSTFLGLSAVGGSAQNLLTNPDFDADPFPTEWYVAGALSATWIPDEGFASGPGCVEIVDDLNNAGCSGIMQILAVTPGAQFRLGGAARIPAGSLAEHAAIFVQWIDGIGNTVDLTTFFDPGAVTGGSWASGSWSVTAPPGAVEAWIRPSMCMPAGVVGDSVVRWDDIFFGPDSEIFSDGFESADTSGWSEAVGD